MGLNLGNCMIYHVSRAAQLSSCHSKVQGPHISPFSTSKQPLVYMERMFWEWKYQAQAGQVLHLSFLLPPSSVVRNTQTPPPSQ